MIFAFIVPSFYPYTYEQQIRGSENLAPMQYSQQELELKAEGVSVFPHFLGTDSLGRDTMIRLMMGSRVSLLVGIVASILVLLIGSTYGAIAGYFGGKVDLIMMRLVDIIYTVPDILIIILLMVTLKYPLQALANSSPAFEWINTIGVGLICIFIVFTLLYWVGMARIVRGQILTLKEQEFVTAARALGASHGRIIRKHLLTNCMGTLIVTTTLQIPSSIFTESFLSFIGIGVAAPMPSLGSMASTAIDGIVSYPYRLLAPAIMISLIILSFNLIGDGLRDAFDPKLKN
jgi:oligopeptide transport system permease protein